MQQRTMVFIGLVIAAVVVLGYALFTMVTNPIPVTSAGIPASSSTTLAATGSPGMATGTAASLYPTPVLGEHTSTVEINGRTIYVALAQDQAQQELGLGNRAGLGADQGMLFMFPSDAQHMFWMKDMSFPIDMIWMSSDGTVIYIAPHVAPSTYPDAFGPNENSRYVLEVPANYAAEQDIVVGDKATLP